MTAENRDLTYMKTRPQGIGDERYLVGLGSRYSVPGSRSVLEL